MSRYERFAPLRAQGLTYKEIAERCGCSTQNVQQTLSRSDKKYFHPFNEKQVVYDGLRQWLNRNKMTIAELIRRKYGYRNGGNSHYYMTDRLSGKVKMNMDYIEFFLKLTGKTYEELFHNKEGA